MTLRDEVIKLAFAKPQLRPHLLPLVVAEEEEAPDIGGASSVLDKAFFGLADEIEDIEDREASLVLKEASFQKEAGVGLIVSIVLSFPKVSEMVGKAINGIARFMKKKFGGDRDPEPSKIGDFLISLGHNLEHRYIRTIKRALWALSKVPGVNRKLDLQGTSDKDLDRVAKVLFYAILVIAAGNAFATAASQMGSLIGMVEGALGTVKAGEVIAAIRSILR